jgi:hypothetical protein
MTRSTIEAMRCEVDLRMGRGERFSDVEDVISASGLSADEKSALWLLGWSYIDLSAQRREANAHLTRLTDAAPAPMLRSRRHLHVAR